MAKDVLAMLHLSHLLNVLPLPPVDDRPSLGVHGTQTSLLLEAVVETRRSDSGTRTHKSART